MEKLVGLDTEKQELDAMVDRLARSPRLAHLLRFIGERYFRSDNSVLHEFDIATEVFGRSADFDPSEDAIARVEAHRLRKKLKFYYDTEGRDNPIQITIPSGTYSPVFTRRPSAARIEVETYKEESAVSVPPPIPSQPLRTRPRWKLWTLSAFAALLTVGVLLVGFERRIRPIETAAAITQSNAAKTVLPARVSGSLMEGASPPGTPVRILAGYTGQPHIDPTGAAWREDRFFDRGGGWRGSQGFTARTNDEFLYRTTRTGEFAYAIPLSPGIYELHIFFDENGFGPGLGGGEGTRTFTVVMNGHNLFQGFDINSDAMGPNIADERIVRDVKPDADGKLHLEFEGVSGKPILNAIEILPGQPHKQLPLRLTTQPTPFIDSAGNMWSPDNYFLGGQSSLQKPPVAGTNDPGLFAMERYGHFTYALPVDLRGTYSLTLYFAEFYFGPDLTGKGGEGSRVFNVLCNGTTLLHDFDIYREAGSLHAVTKTFHHLKPSPQGKLNLTFEPIANYANISAIEVTDESR